MPEANLTKPCVVCGAEFTPRCPDKRRAKFCSKQCQRKGSRKAVATGGKITISCKQCSKEFSYYPSMGMRTFCSRACKNENWRTPSADRGFIDLKDQPFGRWTVLSYAGCVNGHHMWNVRCGCASATETAVSTHGLRSGSTESCGCLAREGKPRPVTKRCRRCNTELPFTAEFFVKRPGFRWGLSPCCKTCWSPISNARHFAWRKKLRAEVLGHYSSGEPQCACCGVTGIEFLTLDHINNDGKEDRRIHGLGVNFYAKMKRLGYPDHLQVLCWNCNLARALHGECPHKRVR